MFQRGDAGAVDLPPQFLASARLGGGGQIGLFADAETFEIVAAPAVHRGVAARGVVQAFFTAADSAVAEVFGQVAVAAFLAVEQPVFEGFFDAVKGLAAETALAVGPHGFQRGAEGLKAAIVGIKNRPMHKIKELFIAFLFG